MSGGAVARDECEEGDCGESGRSPRRTGRSGPGGREDARHWVGKKKNCSRLMPTWARARGRVEASAMGRQQGIEVDAG